MEEQTRTSIRRVKSPEELEVERLLEEIEARKERIAELELELETLKQELGSFQAEIDRRLGPLYVELDRLALRRRRYQARIERLKRQGKGANPSAIEEEISRQFQKEWEDLNQKEKHAKAAGQQPEPEIRSEEEEAELKRIYRKLAKRFHPDLAESESERERNLRIMTEINRAYAEKDLDRLRLLEAREYPEGERVDEPIGEKLVRLIRRRHELDQAIKRIEGEIAGLCASETYNLMQRAREEAERGKDLISEWETELGDEILRARGELAKVIDQFKEVVVEVFWGPLD